jgi:predicted glycosyltransferase
MLIPEIDMVAWGFPNDRKLPRLARLLDREYVARRIAERLELKSIPTIAAHDIVHYVPEQSCIVRITVIVDPLRHPDRSLTLYIKMYHNDDGQWTFAYMRDLSKNQVKTTAVQILAPFDYWPDDRVLLQHEVPGIPLAEFRRDCCQWLDHMPLAAESLAALHRANVFDGSSKGADDWPARFGRVVDLVGRVRPASVDRLREVTGILIGQLPDVQADASVLLHGDLHPRNILIHDGRAALIDFDNVRVGCPCQDLRSFIAGLHYLGVSSGQPSGLIDNAATSFIDAYQTCVAREISPSALRWHTAACIVAERMYRCVTQIHAGRGHLLDDLIELSHRLVRPHRMPRRFDSRRLSKPRVLFYSQHVLGLGHLVRSREIVRSLRDFDVCFLNGGQPVPEFEFPADIEFIQLAPIESTEDFQELKAVTPGRSLTDLRGSRARHILDAYRRFAPDIILLELFPFGRSQFGFELLPLLAAARRSKHRPLVVCSLRDILVTKQNPAAHEERVCQLVNQYFDLVMVHADPTFQKLDESFSRVEDLNCAIEYTGYVVQARTDAPSSSTGMNKPTVPLIVASIGGGRVGVELLRATVLASRIAEPQLPHQLAVFAGPFMAEDDYNELARLVGNDSRMSLRRFTPDLTSYLMKKSDSTPKTRRPSARASARPKWKQRRCGRSRSSVPWDSSSSSSSVLRRYCEGK